MKIDLYLTHARIFNVYLKKFIEGNIAVSGGRFLYIGTVEPPVQPLKTIDLAGKYVIPGMIDCHMHIESTMVAPHTFLRGSVKNGVTTLIAEPHEIANVFGVEGIRALAAAAADGPAHVYIAIPSSVPSTNETLETTGAVIGTAEVEQLLHMDQVICLGEVMNGHDLIADDHSRISELVRQVRHIRPDFPLEGHLPRFLDWDLARILYTGVNSDHTDQSVETVRQRIANGCFIELQDKTLRPDIVQYIIDENLFEHMAIVTDDTMPDDFVERGTLNYLVQKAMNLGFTPEQVVYTTTYTPARRMGLRDRGSIAPGKVADFVILDNLNDFHICSTYCDAKEVYNRNVPPVEEQRDTSFPNRFYHSVHAAPMKEDDFVLPTEQQDGTVRCRLLVVSSDTTFVQSEEVEVPVRNHEIDWDDSPYNLAVVVERHGKNHGRGYARPTDAIQRLRKGKNHGRGYALVGGSALKRGAAATTYAHDHHNLLIIGQNKRDMMTAANAVIEAQGGYAVAYHGSVTAFAPLPIAGILSDQPLPVLGRQIQKVRASLESLGYVHHNVIMSLSTLSLPVSPFYKLTDKGIVDVQKQRIVPLVIDG